MANTSSAKKKTRQIARRTARNVTRRSRVRSFIKKVDVAIESGDTKAAQEALKTAQSELMRGVTKGVYKKTTASRKISRLNKQVKDLAEGKIKPKATAKKAAPKKKAAAPKKEAEVKETKAEEKPAETKAKKASTKKEEAKKAPAKTKKTTAKAKKDE